MEMTEQQAKRIGAKQAVKAVVIGILIADSIMTLLTLHQGIVKCVFWFVYVDYKLSLFVGVVLMILSGYFFGKQAGYEILIKKLNYNWVGFKYGVFTLLTSVFITSWVGFFQQGGHLIGTGDNPFYDYIYKPFFGFLSSD
jgi:hypothetical protein